MNFKFDFPTAILVGLIAFMLVGVALMYPLNGNEFKSEVTTDSASIYVDMQSSILSDYSVCAIDLENTSGRELFIYYDEAYATPVVNKKGLGSLDDVGKLESHLKYLNVKSTRITTSELETLLSDTANASTKSVAVCTGALPCNVYAYDGTSITTDMVRPWMEAGGLVYWMSEARFGYYSAPLDGGDVDWKTNQPLETGSSSYGLSFIGDVEDDDSFGASIRSAVSEVLNIEQNVIMNCAVVGNSSSIVNLGFASEDGRYSIAYAKYGSGGAVVMGGDFTPEISMAKVIASKVCDWADYNPAVQTGQFRGTCQLTFEKSGIDAVYVYMGTLTPRYGSLFVL